MRVRKVSGSETTEYIYFGGQPIAERDATNGDWSDYIFAGGRRIARADNFEYRLRIHGVNSAAGQVSYFVFPNNPQVNGYVIRAGDRIYLRQDNYGAARGGLTIRFTDWVHTAWTTLDQNGYALNNDGNLSGWHLRYADLSAYAGKTIDIVYVANDNQSGAGSWDLLFTDIAIVSADGAVRPIYNRQKTMTLSPGCGGGVSDCWQIVGHPAGIGWHVPTTTYYHGDHLGSSRLMTNAVGTVTWEATYLPFGVEHNPQATTNHYKFTGKERDPESGLDYFGARFYASGIGRFLSTDPIKMNANRVLDPQQLNQYAYARNNPIIFFDPDGMDIVKGGGPRQDDVFNAFVKIASSKEGREMLQKLDDLEAEIKVSHVSEQGLLKDSNNRTTFEVFSGTFDVAKGTGQGEIAVDFWQADAARSLDETDAPKSDAEALGHGLVHASRKLNNTETSNPDPEKDATHTARKMVDKKNEDKDLKKSAKEFVTNLLKKKEKPKTDTPPPRRPSDLYLNGFGGTCGIKRCESH